MEPSRDAGGSADANAAMPFSGHPPSRWRRVWCLVFFVALAFPKVCWARGGPTAEVEADTVSHVFGCHPRSHYAPSMPPRGSAWLRAGGYGGAATVSLFALPFP